MTQTKMPRTKVTVLSKDGKARKRYPVYSGLINYFPNALLEVSHLSQLGSKQHHPDQHLHWDKSKSADHLDALMRHLMEGDYRAVAWRALAHLETEIQEGRYIPQKDYEKSNNQDCPNN